MYEIILIGGWVFIGFCGVIAYHIVDMFKKHGHPTIAMILWWLCLVPIIFLGFVETWYAIRVPPSHGELPISLFIDPIWILVWLIGYYYLFKKKELIKCQKMC